jgi:hypothetical protein
VDAPAELAIALTAQGVLIARGVQLWPDLSRRSVFAKAEGPLHAGAASWTKGMSNPARTKQYRLANISACNAPLSGLSCTPYNATGFPPCGYPRNLYNLWVNSGQFD